MRDNCNKYAEHAITTSQNNMSLENKTNFISGDKYSVVRNCNENKINVVQGLDESSKFERREGNFRNFLALKSNQICFGRRRQQFSPYKRENSVYAQKETEDRNKKNWNYKKKGNYKKNIKQTLEFKYGNYHQYYGYRNQGTIDSRLLCMRKEWFYEKDVLDIGCNAGHFTLSVARDFSPRSVVGMDIDHELVKIAKKNVRHYINYDYVSDNDFPLSLAVSYGPIAQALDPKYRYTRGNFPFNVQFIQGNYILSSDELLQWQEAFFDTVLCLSLTKWIHLNWGDVGMKQLFHRVFAHLRPGGAFILEAQSWQSYARKKKITEEIFKHYNQIKFFPEMFNEYLVKEVGFKSCELIDTPAHSSKGFSRPIYLFLKSSEADSCQEKKSKHIIYKSDSESSFNYSDVEQFSD